MAKHEVQYTYLSCCPKQLAEERRFMVDMLWPHRKQFDTIVVSGHSGALMGGMLSVALNRGLLLTRKRYKWGGKTQGEIGERFIIVDDFIGHGSTIDNMLKEVGKLKLDFETKCVGIFLYKPSLSYVRASYRGIRINHDFNEHRNGKMRKEVQ